MHAKQNRWFGVSMLVLGAAVTLAYAAAPQAATAQAATAQEASAQGAAAQATYESLLERARRGESGFDFTALRMASAARLAKTDAADPELRRKLFDALHQGKWDAVIETGEKVLAQNYLDIDAHMFVAYAYEKKNEPEKAAPHRAMGDGLMSSILASGNGRTMERAFVVISVDEEYSVLRHYRLVAKKQALVNGEAHSYDVISAQTADTHDDATVYFNIDRVVAIENAQLSGH